MPIDKKKVDDLMSKIYKVKKDGNLDLSSDEDLSIAVMNLVSIEEHLFFTATKTGKMKYLEVLDQVRLMRRDLLKKIIKDYEGEVWCISKHLLAATMRLEEVGTKQLKKGDQKQAWELFQMAYKLYSLFWGLNLGLVNDKELKMDIKKAGFKEDEFIDNKQIVDKTSGSFFDKLGAVVKKAIDCCIE